ncbi:38347_t:CDS:2 [Gigaspora margarita]|uniref:38347_t:CDS:1 n=1 Tax=Gigaspora margarita TaxID=4874 RepID=A0ABN7W6R6_GIGMA|nr:38347_t:CDS:2 [Gigaspora margarita]
MYQPPHPPSSPTPPIDTFSSPQNILRFRDFHAKHFTQKNFFLHALNPNPQHIWYGVEGSENWKQEPEFAENFEEWNEEEWNGEEWNGEEWNGEEWNGEELNGEEWNEEWNEEEEEEKVEFVLSEEAISMFRFSELRKQQLADANSSSTSQIQSSEQSDDLSTTIYLTSEPDPSLISPTNLTAVELQQLYGDSYQSIAILEAAVNSIYIQSCEVDKNHDDNINENPSEIVYWPVVPLRFV